jgi:hypothetical protein
MSLKGLIGGVLGGVVGFFFGGLAGAMYGAALGFGIGFGLDMKPDHPASGQPQFQKLDMTTASEGLPVADLLGISQLAGNILQYHNNRMVELTEEVGGKGGSQTVTTGYEYYLTWAVAFCKGPVDFLYTITEGDEVVWEGALARPVSGGVETITLAGVGTVDFYFGTEDQAINSLLATYETNQIPYRGLCYAVFRDCNIGSSNRLPVYKFVMSKQPVLTFNAKNVISTFDYNPAHAIWYILIEMVGLPTTYLNETSFSDAAEILFGEARGVSILFANQKESISWIEQTLQHIDAALRYGIDGKFHLYLLRPIEDTTLLPLITKDEMLDVPQMDRKSWLDTLNEIKVQYPKRMVREGLCPDGCDNFTAGDFSEIAPGETRTFTIQNDEWIKTGCTDLSFLSDGLPPSMAGVFSNLQALGHGEWSFDYTANASLCSLQEGEENPVCPVICGRTIKCCPWVCDDEFYEDMAVDWAWTPEEVAKSSSISVRITGGRGPFEWSISPMANAQGFNLKWSGGAELRSNYLYADATACGGVLITVKDACKELYFSIRCTTGVWVTVVDVSCAEHNWMPGGGWCTCGGTVTLGWQRWYGTWGGGTNPHIQYVRALCTIWPQIVFPAGCKISTGGYLQPPIGTPCCNAVGYEPCFVVSEERPEDKKYWEWRCNV